VPPTEPVPDIREVLEKVLFRMQDSLRSAMEECQQLGDNPSTAEYDSRRSKLLAEISRLAVKVEKLNNFLNGVPPPRSDAELDAIRKSMPSLPHFSRLNKAFAEAMKKGKPGAKRTSRDLFLDVFDLMLQSQNISLGKAIVKVRGNAHVDALRESIRIGIRDNLKPILREFAPEVLERFEKLHPDRRSMRRRTPPPSIPSS